MNLVTNAHKYTPVGFVRVSLKQKSRPGPRRRFDAVLSGTDCGIGMSKEFQKNHLFRDFSQGDAQSSGLGIGMHMVARIVSAMGGKIEVTSDQKGVGTRVTATVPLEDHRDRSKPGAWAVPICPKNSRVWRSASSRTRALLRIHERVASWIQHGTWQSLQSGGT